MASIKGISPGQSFGRLTFLRRIEGGRGSGYPALFRCECGTEKVISLPKVIYRGRQSCGCLTSSLRSSNARTHGKRHTPEYNCWASMKARCLNPRDHAYIDYGGRGITVCERWRNSFENFLADMGPRPPNTSLDRINNNASYEPSNCRWASQQQQVLNTRVARVFTISGVTLSLSQWADLKKCAKKTLRRRLAIMPPDQAIGAYRAAPPGMWNRSVVTGRGTR